ncbi:MAG TPA: hypothetical protein VER98_01035 [Terriglobia bacterium]|nr:hypothetical protein [Terriglobia bacterium]
MRSTCRVLTILTGLAVVLALGQILIGQAPGQRGGGARGGGAPAGPIVRGPEGKPDFTGYWISATKTNINNGRGGIINPDTGAADGKIPYNAEWEVRAADTTKNHMYDEPYAHCLPSGVPTNFGIQMGFQAVQDKNAIVFAWDTAGSTRIIYLDGRKHVPANIRLYQGDSIGRWEGDTLVVDTTSQAAGWWDANGAVHSDASHVVEKFTPKDSNTIAYEALVEDPVALTRPMTVTDTFRRNINVPAGFRNRPTGYEQTETACIEGEQDTALYTESGGGFAKDREAAADAPPGTVSAGGRGAAGGRGERGGRGGGPPR